jgi:hypothetical protein
MQPESKADSESKAKPCSFFLESSHCLMVDYDR